MGTNDTKDAVIHAEQAAALAKAAWRTDSGEALSSRMQVEAGEAVHGSSRREALTALGKAGFSDPKSIYQDLTILAKENVASGEFVRARLDIATREAGYRIEGRAADGVAHELAVLAGGAASTANVLAGQTGLIHNIHEVDRSAPGGHEGELSTPHRAMAATLSEEARQVKSHGTRDTDPLVTTAAQYVDNYNLARLENQGTTVLQADQSFRGNDEMFARAMEREGAKAATGGVEVPPNSKATSSDRQGAAAQHSYLDKAKEIAEHLGSLVGGTQREVSGVSAPQGSPSQNNVSKEPHR